ncbi:DedA family protein [Alicyclobacillus cycloheptanicus]|uniref:Membrane protein DedA with SNARE-associated domain n=1 Tax=Alicyclobacillus cycloheptanicus TaxID=1457 RepID=A0ABT9XFY3_9BACL|nr:DedA family protein [Alicyclobacillus cycloheptanicus]MDQ0189207.1 membrane protein DedA with SNARE-associated domain [Alicyclobacillus cycloheptanicus]WDM00392.1 DedA family protein [Alicyclobacillus cycloheptanicus]
MNFMHWIQSYGYPGLYVMLALEYVIFVVPGETTLTTVGILWKNGAGHFSFLPLLLASGLGTFTGSILAYAIGRWLGRPVLVKYGKYVFLTEDRLKRSEAMFRRHTILTLVVSRYIAVVRDIVPYIAGINRVKLRVFLPIIFVASFVWTGSFILAGSLIEQALVFVVAHWRIALVPAVILAVACYFGYRALHKRLEQQLDVSVPQDTGTDAGHPTNLP